MSPLDYIFQYSLTHIFWVEWFMRDWRGRSGGQKGSRNHDVVHVSCFLFPGSPRWCEGMTGPAMASCSLCPSSASSSSGPDMCMFSSVTKCLGLYRTLVTSRSRWQVLIWVSVHPHGVYRVLVHTPFTFIPSQLLPWWTSWFSIRHKDSYLPETA